MAIEYTQINQDCAMNISQPGDGEIQIVKAHEIEPSGKRNITENPHPSTKQPVRIRRSHIVQAS